MVYSYNEKKREVKAVKTPKIKGKDAKRMKEASTPVELFEKINGMNFNVVKA